ncbi:MAG: C-GCAxxG-C-C family protein [Desulfobacterales bacterium]|nr:C-GCAxxG-C-C family protein [Desulfobacterales bacterium]
MKEEKYQELLLKIKDRAENLFLTRQLLCTESVLTVLNGGLRGGMPEDLAIRIATGLPNGLGGSGCICGALNGSVLAAGLFFGRNGCGFGNGNNALTVTNQLHDEFKKRFGSACCRVLTKKVISDPDRHFRFCAELTGKTAEMAAVIILKKKPDLVKTADLEYLDRKDTRVSAFFKKASGFFQ